MPKQSKAKRPMAFYHQDGLDAAWIYAQRYAGKNGRIATLPDIIAGKIAAKPGDLPWTSYFTTSTAEYFGSAANGDWAVIIAHGVGPMSTLDGALKAYSYRFKDKSRDNRGGRITRQEFLDLESGKYGDVSVIKLATLLKAHEDPFFNRHRASDIMNDPLLVARLGSRADEFVALYRDIAKDWHEKQHDNEPPNSYALPNWQKSLLRLRHQHLVDRCNPCLIFNNPASNCLYGYDIGGGVFKILCQEDEVIAHLVSIGGTMHTHHNGSESLITDIHCHEWGDGVRLLAVPAGANLAKLRKGPESMQDLIKKHWPRLLEPITEPEQPGLRALMKMGGSLFTQYPKFGERMDTHEPEYEVVSSKKIGQTVTFETRTGGPAMFFKYGISEVQALVPREANAYMVVGGIKIVGRDADDEKHLAQLEFYKIEVNAAARIKRAYVLARDIDTVMALVG